MLRDFKPLITKETTDSATIEATFKRGDVAEGLQACKKTGRSLVEFAPVIAAGMRKMYVSGRSNELLSLIYKRGLPCPYDIPTLLRPLLAKNDFPGFLKQASRFEVYKGFEADIQRAIESLRSKKQHGPADAYQRRFDDLRRRSAAP